MLRHCLPMLHFLLRMPRRASLGFGSPSSPALLLGLRLRLLSPLCLFPLIACRPGLSLTGSALLLGLRLLSPLCLLLRQGGLG